MASFKSRILDRVLRILTARSLDPNADPRTLREKLNRLAIRFAGKAPGIDVQKIDIDGLPAEWLTPRAPDHTGTLLYLHGGGYIICSPDTHRPMIAALARQANARALVIDYRLAPEHPFPAGIDDALKAYRWLIAQGTPASSITVAGDSAGGGLTLALLLSLRDAGEPMPAAAALLSPWTDLTMSGWSHITHRKRDPMLTTEGALLASHHYLAGASPADPLASPLYGRFGGLPPLFIHVGGNEILLDDSLRLAEKARAAGVPVEIKVWDGVPHVFQAFHFLPEARASLSQIAAFLKSRMAGFAAASKAAE
ncbi:MAG TPA: alpha/beta hydrolase [Parvibaculum sp.]|jgi:acetyl esterase/lipase